MLHSSQAPGARAWYCVARAHCVMPSGANDLAWVLCWSSASRPPLFRAGAGAKPDQQWRQI